MFSQNPKEWLLTNEQTLCDNLPKIVTTSEKITTKFKESEPVKINQAMVTFTRPPMTAEEIKKHSEMYLAKLKEQEELKRNQQAILGEAQATQSIKYSISDSSDSGILQPEADTSAAYANTQNERQGLKQKKAKKAKSCSSSSSSSSDDDSVFNSSSSSANLEEDSSRANELQSVSNHNTQSTTPNGQQLDPQEQHLNFGLSVALPGTNMDAFLAQQRLIDQKQLIQKEQQKVLDLESKSISMQTTHNPSKHHHNHDQSDSGKSKGRRILCCGMCLTGPHSSQYGALAILLLITTDTAAMAFLTHQEIFVQGEPSIALSFLLGLATSLGLWTMVSHVCVMCSDPGVLTRNGPAISDEYRDECLDLEETERAVFETDPIYQHSMYYQFRQCETCMLTRTPKASHCGQCGHCVQGWDHHCMALNNCVGARNMRAFVTFLTVSFLFALTVVISSGCVLFLKRDYTERSDKKLIGVGCGLFIAVVTLCLTVKPRFNNTCRLVVLMAGAFSSIALTMVFCRDLASFLAASGIYIAMGYDLVISDMLFEYLDLVSRHLTTKEKAARLQSTKEKCLDKDSDFKRQDVSTKLKCMRFWVFCCARKIPKSQITSADGRPQKVTVVYANNQRRPRNLSNVV